MAVELTMKQKTLLHYLEKEVARTGKSPSLRQAASDMGVSHAAISQLIKMLEAKGVVRRDGRYGRNLLLLNRIQETTGSMRWVEVPVIGSIAAGLPLYAQQEWDGSIVVDSSIYRGTNLFALRIRGDSMKNAAILDRDIVICEPRQFAENGEIIVALIHQEEATVKRFFLREKQIELCPENPAFKPVTYAFNEILIQGKVIGVQRGPEGMERL
ncbi:MAG: transcriptional repressor LexA [Deltaproteobacteria bacterium]|nr:transcriptional repressor LexA [Deltaproteobacteria bacterium]